MQEADESMWRHHVETLTGRGQCTVAHRAQAPRASALNSRALTTQVASGASLSRRRQHAAVALMAATRRTRLVKTQLCTPRLPARPKATLTRTRCPIGWPLAWSTRAGAEGLLGRRKSTGRWGACSTVGRVVRDMAWIRLPAFRCMHVCRPGESFLHLFAPPPTGTVKPPVGPAGAPSTARSHTLGFERGKRRRRPCEARSSS